ncbi:hypothetical protein KDA_49320 [Dictyobacter alpinus]|uniref:Methyltransferase domain-containing protein n=2 Tax=Dictyobacter alpinus TaxID=2014873 RepID=A0A402BDH0_9CHLR|nr:hypothetical protein KDA_49320 [Dictyobacter alpinus]
MVECAQTYKNACIVGVDTREAMVRCAAIRSKVLPHLSVFHLASYTDFALFQDASFDIISLHCAQLPLSYQQWIHLLQEGKRLLKKGGWIRLTAFEYARSNAPTLNTWNELEGQMEGAAQNFSHALQSQLYELEPLVAANFWETVLIPHLINFSYGTPIHKGWTQDLLLQAQQRLPFMAQRHIITHEYISPFLHQMHLDFARPTFHAIHYGMTVWGRKEKK